MSRPLVITALAGILLVVIGGGILFSRPVSFGWTSQGPACDATFGPWVVVLDGVNLLAALGALAGIALLSGALGFYLARRLERPQRPRS